MTWEKGQVRVGAGGRPMPDPTRAPAAVYPTEIVTEEKPVSKQTTSSKSKKTEKKSKK